jgi:YgiT-type zinc finger domain-containing protein
MEMTIEIIRELCTKKSLYWTTHADRQIAERDIRRDDMRKMMDCFFCKGELEEKETIFTAAFDECVVIIKNVPSLVCKQCGEVVHSDVVSRRLEEMIASIKAVEQACQQVTEITVVQYSDKAA